MKKLNVIGLTGYKSAGKDTAGSFILNALRVEGYMVAQDMFAKGLKDMLAIVGYPCPETQEKKEAIIPELGVSWRHMAQTLGTEWRQLIHPHLWLMATEKRVQVARSFCTYTVITDVRFDYEADWVRKNGWLVHILCQPMDGDTHLSEQALPVVEGDFVIQNFRQEISATHQLPHYPPRTLENLKYWCEVTARTIMKDSE